ncbi:UNVERIFIED_CONTAM: hypothetical protein N8J90_05810 [Halobacillus marinus]|uniref:hypothetical protein n=1 Tax=Halobacillus sp. BAB-2008 TaxID=1246484 RepID=UPI0002A4EFFD|nr:hypothetical protein [Halobacillus sp. BAB-2008]ELK48059.1 hypothetical protein D479_04068 [Halobacillus sp. BAB-2008]
MVQSFLNYFLPKDEYKRSQIVYFMAEAAFLTVLLLLPLTLMNNIWWNSQSFNEISILLTPVFVMAYTYFRYVFKGIEHTDISEEKTYRAQRRLNRKRALFFAAIFMIVLLINNGIPSTGMEILDIAGPVFLGFLFYLLFDYISLKRSYNKNKDLLDD